MEAQASFFTTESAFAHDLAKFQKSQEIIGALPFVYTYMKAPLPMTEGKLFSSQHGKSAYQFDSGTPFAVFVNACPHQGRTLYTEPSHSNSPVSCKGHFARFNDNGSLSSFKLYEQHLPKDLSPCKEFRLKNLNFKTWADRMYLRLDPSDWEDFSHLESQFSMGDYSYYGIARTSKKTIHSNWKIPLIVYFDVLHVPAIHPGLRNLVSMDTLEWEFFKNGNLQTIGIKQNLFDECDSSLSEAQYNKPEVAGLKAYLEGVKSVLKKRPELASHHSLKTIKWFAIYPGETHEIYPFTQIVTRTIPVSAHECKQIVEFYIHEAFRDCAEGVEGFVNFYNQTADEDNELAELQQRGYESMHEYRAEPGRTHPHFERGTAHFLSWLYGNTHTGET